MKHCIYETTEKEFLGNGMYQHKQVCGICGDCCGKICDDAQKETCDCYEPKEETE